MKVALVLSFLGVCAIAVVAACSSTSSGGGGATEAGASDAGSCAKIDSACGQPCDKGNALGVGLFCKTVDDCSGTTTAHLCSTLGAGLTSGPPTYYCTFECSAPDAGSPDGAPPPFPTDCGEGARCACANGVGCGCTPSSCM